MAESVVMFVYQETFDGYAVKFHPFQEYWLAVAASDRHYKNSRINLHDFEAGTSPIAAFPVPGHGNHIYDCSWSAKNPNQIIAAGEDGVIRLIDVAQRPPDNAIIGSYARYHQPIRSVQWNSGGNKFLAGSEDGNVVLWDIEKAKTDCFPHPGPVHSAAWDSHCDTRFATACHDGYLRIFEPLRGRNHVAHARVDQEPLISCSWNWHGPPFLVTATRGRSHVKIWDMRRLDEPVHVLHQINQTPIRKVMFSPHWSHEVAAGTDERDVILWDYGQEAGNPLITPYQHHDGPVHGLDMSNQAAGLLATTGPDGIVQTWMHAPPV